MTKNKNIKKLNNTYKNKLIKSLNINDNITNLITSLKLMRDTFILNSDFKNIECNKNLSTIEFTINEYNLYNEVKDKIYNISAYDLSNVDTLTKYTYEKYMHMNNFIENILLHMEEWELAYDNSI